MNLFTRTILVLGSLFGLEISSAATLTGNFSPVAQGSNVNLTAEGKLDWVHWGLANETSLNRKTTVVPKISDFVVLYQIYTAAYPQTDNLSGYSWSDGTQVEAVTNTPTGVYVFGPSNFHQTNGFQFTVPADTALQTLKVYVGTYAARGGFEARLSDHPIAYVDTSLSNDPSGPGGVYTINFAANSANQTLTIRWYAFAKNGSGPNVTLQAASLSAAGANNPPFAKITSPAMNSVFSAPANITIDATGFDPDDSIARVEFRSNGMIVGERTSSPCSLSLSNVAPGYYQFTANPVDQTNATSSSRPVDVFVHSSGGTLTGSVAFPPAGVNLTSEGTLDWVHWGLSNATNVNRKLGVPARISMTASGTNLLQRYADNYTGYGWSDGMPTASAGGTKTGVFLLGITNGFQFSVPADTAPKTLKIYVGLYSGSGNFQAWLSDFSAPAFTDRSLTNAYGSSYAVYTLDYTAASIGQRLNVKYTSDYSFDQEFGNVTLQAATLGGTASVELINSKVSFGDFIFSLETDTNRTYDVYYTDFLDPINWQPLTTIIGSGATQTVTNSASQPQRFYRIQTN